MTEKNPHYRSQRKKRDRGNARPERGGAVKASAGEGRQLAVCRDLTAWTPIFKKGEPSDTAKIFAVHFEPGGVVQRPGTVETDKRTYLAVACADGRIVVDELQIAGKRRMSARDLLPGMRDLSDYSFGEEAAEA